MREKTDLESNATERPKTGAYFNVGDVILYGKYKNKRGRIVTFGLDEKGQPTVEIEPIPKGQKQNKKLTLFKIRKAPPEGKTANTAQRVSTRAKVIARYLIAYGERETSLIVQAYKHLKESSEKLKAKNEEYERTSRRAPQKKALGDITGSLLGSARRFAEITRDGIELFMKGYKATSEEKAKDFETVSKQWNAWKRDHEAFITSATRYLAKGDPDDYSWPVNLIDGMLNATGAVVGSIEMLTVPTFNAPEIDEKASMMDTLRVFTTGKVVGIARKVVQGLGRDKAKAYLFVRDILEDVNLSQLSRAMQVQLKAYAEDETVSDLATQAGKTVRWYPPNALGLAYAVLKTVGAMDKAEFLLAEAAEDKWFKWRFKNDSV